MGITDLFGRRDVWPPEAPYPWDAVTVGICQGDARSATRFFRQLLRALRSVPPGTGHRQARQLRRGPPTTVDTQHGASSIDVSEQPEARTPTRPTRQRERAMKKFTSPGGAQRFLSAFSGISPHFQPCRHRFTAVQYRHEMTTLFTTWDEIVGLHSRLTQTTA
jgi:putative transposase